jgi:ADP-ribose pyrophosphatase
MIQQPEPIEQRSIFTGRIFEARVDTVLMPDGSQLTREVVDHPGAVAIVPINDNSEVILVRQYRYPAGQRLLEIPAGTLEPDESPDATAQRELQEEIGFASRNLRALGAFFASPGFCTEFIYLYLARDPVPSKLEGDDDEDINVETIPLSRVDQLIRHGEIQDGKSIAGLLMARYLFS